MPQPFLGPPFRAFPSLESRAPLEAASSPAVIHRRAESRRLGPYHRRFPRLPPARARSCLTPPTTMSSLSTPPKRRFPLTLGTLPPEPIRSASFTHLEALFLQRVRSRSPGVAPQRAADTLLGFRPSRAFSAHTSGPRTHAGKPTCSPRPKARLATSADLSALRAG